MVFVMPSSSARCSQLPRCVDKLPFYVALRKLRDHLRGDLPDLDDAEVTFPDLDLKVEPKKEKLDPEVKQEATDPETNTNLMSKQQAFSGTFQLSVEIKTEDGSVAGKQRKGRRKRSSAVASDGKEVSLPSGSNGTVCSPYFQPWHPLSSCFPNPVAARDSTTTATTCGQVKQEPPVDFHQYGCMPEDLSAVRTSGGTLPLPVVQSRFCWPPASSL